MFSRYNVCLLIGGRLSASEPDGKILLQVLGHKPMYWTKTNTNFHLLEESENIPKAVPIHP